MFFQLDLTVADLLLPEFLFQAEMLKIHLTQGLRGFKG